MRIGRRTRSRELENSPLKSTNLIITNDLQQMSHNFFFPTSLLGCLGTLSILSFLLLRISDSTSTTPHDEENEIQC